MSSIKVTICVPTYNAAKYLNRCIDSLIKQTLRDIEIIIINDGSTDNTAEICESYAKLDSRIRIIHLQNSGSAVARQVALNNAKGEYIIVCDSDDWVEASMYEKLYLKAKETNADLIYSGTYFNYPNGREIKKLPTVYPTNSKDLIHAILNHRILPSTCNKLIKLKFIKDNKISYTPQINVGEDLLFILKIAKYPIKIAYVNDAFYHYVRMVGSNSYTNNPKPITFDELNYIYQWKKQNLNHKEYGQELFISAIDVAYLGIRIKNLKPEKFNIFINNEIQFKDIIKYRKLNLKIGLVLISKINYRLAKIINQLFYRLVYK